MIEITEQAYAKLNLTLDVLGKRPDGYHDLRSVMQGISLCDEVQIFIGVGKEWKIVCTEPGIPTDEKNLAWRAARAFCNTVGFKPGGLEIRIEKRIPAGAGLGGGSADAAAVLRGLNRHCGNPLSVYQLAEVGATVGSDVPFCVLLGTAMAEGRGERLRVLPGIPACSIVVCKPDFSISTPELYRKLDESVITHRPNNKAMEEALNLADLHLISNEVLNVFDEVVAALHPELDEIKAVCKSFGSLCQQMTGSGSAVFAIMPDEQAASAACKTLSEKFPQTFLVKPV